MVTAATGALKPVLEKLAALVSDELYRRFKGVSSDIKFLTDELAAMHAFLLKMSEVEEPDVQDQAWIMEVRELSYDLEDNLDEFILRMGDKTAKQSDFIGRCKNMLTKMKTRHRIDKAIEDFKAQVKEVGERHARYRTCDTIINTSNVRIDRRALAIFENASNLVGIDESKGELIKLMAQEGGCASMELQLKVIAIVGPGGLGKTTLANQVYQSLKGDFDCGAFISVSRNPDMMRIFRTVLSEVSHMGYTDTDAGDENQLITRISNFLADKRCCLHSFYLCDLFLT